ncbi:MAG: zinc-ribbon domain-containing protein [Ruminococcaceae bacterium]|nr:zinc-ribbon domain-containing protein [Oscillospiraceae bacterium]
MFCKNCGAQLPDNAKFCAVCAAPTTSPEPAYTAQQPTYAAPQPTYAPQQPTYEAPQPQYTNPQQPYAAGQPQYAAPQQPYVAPAPKEPSPTMTNFLSAITKFWVKPVGTVGNAAKSTSLEWIILAAISVFSYALGSAVVGAEMSSQLFKSILGSLSQTLNVGRIYPFFAVFGIGILIGSAAFALTALGIWLLVGKIFGKKVSLFQAFNMTAVASLPLIAVNTFNMLAGLIYAPIAIVLFMIALIMTVICLYTGMQKFDKLDKSPYYGFIIIITAVALVVALFSILYIAAIKSSISGFVSNAMSGMGDMLDMFM